MHEQFERHERNDKIKWIVTGVAFLLVFVLIGSLFGLLLRSKGKNDEPKNEPTVKVQTHILSFNDVEKRTSYSELKQVWEDNGITFTNLKGSGSNVGDYHNPVRLYTHSTFMVECDDMTRIVFYCIGATHVGNLRDSLDENGISVSVNNNDVTLEFDKAVDSFEVTDIVGQIQLSQLAVTAAFPVQSNDAELPKEDAEDDESESMVVTDSASHNMSLMVARSVEPLAANVLESVTITATVKPDNTAENTGIDWSIKWKNPSSSWAMGKVVTDYVTVTPKGNDYAASKTATLNNLQPFGEQIVVTATARDNPSVTATCTVDYVQKVTNFSLSFGTVTCNFGGTTGVTIEINSKGSPIGGAANLTKTMSSAYSLADNFTVKYSITPVDTPLLYEDWPGMSDYWLDFGYATEQYNRNDLETVNAKLDRSKLLNHNVAQKGLYFGMQYFRDNLGLNAYYRYYRAGGVFSFPADFDSYYSPASIVQRYTAIKNGGTYNDGTYEHKCSGLDLFKLTVKIEGAHSSLEKTTTFTMNGYTNTSPISSMEVSDSAYVF